MPQLATYCLLFPYGVCLTPESVSISPKLHLLQMHLAEAKITMRLLIFIAEVMGHTE